MVLAFRLPGDLAVDVPADLPDELASAIRLAVRRVFDHIAGAWTVAVQRYSERGRWRIELRGVTGRHVWTVLARPECCQTSSPTSSRRSSGRLPRGTTRVSSAPDRPVPTCRNRAILAPT